MIKSLEPMLLSKAPLNSTHWKKTHDIFVRMGDANVTGYVKLNDVRRAVSISILRSMNDLRFLKSIVENAPDRAIAYSLGANHYLGLDMSDFIVLGEGGKSRKLLKPADLKTLLYLDHVQARIIDLKSAPIKPWQIVGA